MCFLMVLLISEWFLQTKVVHPDSLGKKYDLSDYGIESNPHIVQTQKIQKIIDEAAANWRWGHLHP